jgi:predicted kinase
VSTLYLFCGLPGSGKSTVARILADDEGAVRLAPDDWLQALALDLRDDGTRSSMRELHWQHAQELLVQGVSVILEFGLPTRAERDEKRSRARELDASVELWFLDDDRELLWSRVERRNESGAPGAVPVERDAFLAWAESFEVPDADELALYDMPDPGHEGD